MDHLLSRENFDKMLRQIIYHPTVENACLQAFVKIGRFIAVTFLKFKRDTPALGLGVLYLTDY